MNIRDEMARAGIKLTKAAAETQIELSKTALEDCNKFCKFDTGETRDSSLKASDFIKGRLIWNTPYARHAYYLGEADRSKNPLASRLWAHKAAALYSDKWRAAAKQKFVLAMLR
ncbi:MAG: minor capsid protein [Oscillospiraceae bacterium]|nr:minor capsid protein [Oscillospiraceae bacterium]